MLFCTYINLTLVKFSANIFVKGDIIFMDQIIHKMQDMTHLIWTQERESSGTAGSFLKSYEKRADGKIYYKLSTYNSVDGITGHECINEIIVDRLLTLLHIEHLSYQLIHAMITIDNKQMETWLCASKDFKKPGEDKIAFDVYYEAEKTFGETPLDFCIRAHWQKNIYEMFLVDFLILNRDRHGGNIEILRNKKNQTMRLAPLFDHGLSFFCRNENDVTLDKIDIMEDKRIQCFMGKSSAWENLSLIPVGQEPEVEPLKKEDIPSITAGLEGIISEKRIRLTQEMIWKRWEKYESFCNQRKRYR